jgi:hypothetical protein
MSPADLATLLLDSAGTFGRHAAVQLLTAQGHWLREAADRPDEMALHVDTEDGELYAELDWTTLGDRLARHELVGSPGELAVLRVACSLAGYPITFGDLSSLDAGNVRLVLAAVAQAAGKPGVFPS